MTVQICLEEVSDRCSFIPLAVVGYCLTRSGVLQPLWSTLHVDMKIYDHTATEKLQDVLVAIMAGCRSLAQVNTRLRPERVLAAAWQRPVFAEQSNLNRTLDALQTRHLAQLRAGNLLLLQQYSQLCHHDWAKFVILDVDPTSLITSKHAEGSRKGWVSEQKNAYCRHVIRFTLAGYHESLLSAVYPGDRHGFECFQPACQELLRQWPWSRAQRSHIIIRSDAEQGTDANVSYLLDWDFQVLMKGYSGRRTLAWVQRTPETLWQQDHDHADRWAAPTPERLRFGHPLDSYLLRRRVPKDKFLHATFLMTLPYPVFQLWKMYDGRGATEVEIRSDKSGLELCHRRKSSLNAQEGWLVLTDIAHNLLAWLCPWMLAGSSFETFGPKRLVQDLLTIPGSITFEEGRLRKIGLLETHPYADEMRFCLHKLLKTFNLT
jgi:hypothetical protein